MLKLSIQLSLPSIYSHINNSFVSNKSNLLSLLEKHINFDSFIPLSFRYAFYSHMDRNHIYHLDSFIRALVFQKLLAIDFDTLLINILKLLPELCDFCGFRKVPDSSQFSRFRKIMYLLFLRCSINLLILLNLFVVKLTKGKLIILSMTLLVLNLMLLKTILNFLMLNLNKLKKFSKTNDSNPYIAVYPTLPSSSSTNSEACQQYINSHFCYALKVGIVTNGLGIIRHISFFDKEFKKNTLIFLLKSLIIQILTKKFQILNH